MELEIIMLSKISLTQKDKDRIHVESRFICADIYGMKSSEEEGNQGQWEKKGREGG